MTAFSEKDGLPFGDPSPGRRAPQSEKNFSAIAKFTGRSEKYFPSPCRAGDSGKNRGSAGVLPSGKNRCREAGFVPSILNVMNPVKKKLKMKLIGSKYFSFDRSTY
ncbi:hypothetical protein [Desulfococcus sp.]|uniref:hypothetical protein n=1 Tax=Desulfococcus sp. TaxID=2025834 RepID=UPI003593E6BA